MKWHFKIVSINLQQLSLLMAHSLMQDIRLIFDKKIIGYSTMANMFELLKKIQCRKYVLCVCTIGRLWREL